MKFHSPVTSSLRSEAASVTLGLPNLRHCDIQLQLYIQRQRSELLAF